MRATLLLVATILVLLASQKVRASDIPYPGCAWWTMTTATTANIGFPDTSAAYWTMPYYWSPSLEFVLKGQYPNARFFSLQVYTTAGGNFQVATPRGNISSGVQDAKINPDPKTINPWRGRFLSGRCARTKNTTCGGTFTVTVTNKLFWPKNNTLPLRWTTKMQDGALGYLMMRVYMPVTGNFSDVVLPNVTMIVNGTAYQLPGCNGTLATPLPDMSSSTSGGEATNWNRSPSTPNAFGGSDSPPYPNGVSAYLRYPLPAPNAWTSDLLVTQFRAANAVRGSSPTLWPSNEFQLRYYSICNNINELPLPVVANPLPGGGVQYGCLNNDQLVRDEGSANITVVVSLPSKRPANATNWLPTSILPKYENATEELALRNMYCNDNFNYCFSAAPANGNAADAQQALGPFYPVSVYCSKSVFDKGRTAAEGARLCFEAAKKEG